MLRNIIQGLGVIHATFGTFSLGELFYVGVLSTQILEIDMRTMIFKVVSVTRSYTTTLFGVAIGYRD